MSVVGLSSSAMPSPVFLIFVSEKAAKEGVVISNHSKVEPLVILKHFAPNNKEIPQKSPLWED